MPYDKSTRRGKQLHTQRRGSLNKRANQAAKAARLNAQQRQAFHQYLTNLGNDELSFQDLVNIAQTFK